MILLNISFSKCARPGDANEILLAKWCVNKPQDMPERFGDTRWGSGRLAGVGVFILPDLQSLAGKTRSYIRLEIRRNDRYNRRC
jgi:hypothetical protein